MKLSLSCLLTLILFGLSHAASAQVTNTPVSDEDQATFKDNFREKLSTVNRTRNTTDDLELAVEMMEFAADIPDDPGVQCLIYIEVIPLAASGLDLSMMGEAVALLDKRWPGHKATSIENQLDLAARAYRAARNTNQRVPVGEAYIDLLMSMVQQSSDQNNLKQAIDIGRLANTIARAIDSEQRERIGLIIDQLSTENMLADRIEKLTQSVKRNPQNKPSARDLVELLVTKRNDPAAASAFVQSTGDEALIELVNFAAKGTDQASAANAMRVGDWYRALADDEEGLYAEQLLVNARAWYARFFTEYTRKDALAKRVKTMDESTEQMLASLRESMGVQDPQGDWVDLIKGQFDLERQASGGEARVIDNEIQCKACQLLFPLKAEASYEFELSFKVMEYTGTEKPMVLLFPVDDHFYRVRFSYAGTLVLRGDQDDQRYRVEDRGDELGKTIRLLTQIAINEDNAKIAVLLNGNPAMSWEGEIEDLEDAEYYELPEAEDEADVVRVFVRNPSVIKTVRFREQK
jgi:hypothetical protein